MCITSCFSVAALKNLSLFLAFHNLTIMCHSVNVFPVILFGIIELLGCVDLGILLYLGSFQPLFLQIFFAPSSHCLYSGNLTVHVLV